MARRSKAYDKVIRRASDHGPAASVDGVFIPVVEDAVRVIQTSFNVDQSLHFGIARLRSGRESVA